MIQSNGDMFAALIGSKHARQSIFGAMCHLSITQVLLLETSLRIPAYTTGTWRAGGPTGTSGTFAQIVQPDLIGVFSSNYQLGCENPSYAAGMSANAWPYTNIHYYSITQPPTANVLDWKVWLIGFEYVNGSPYLYNTVHYVWEP